MFSLKMMILFKNIIILVELFFLMNNKHNLLNSHLFF